MRTRTFSPDLMLAEMTRLGVSRRELSRRLKPDNPEYARALLHKHLTRFYKEPQVATVERYAEALGVTYEALTVEDEESAEVEALTQRLSELRRRQERRTAA